MVPGFLTDPPADVRSGISLDGARTEMRGLQLVSERINRANDLESLLACVLQALEEFFAFSHTSVLLWDEQNRRVTTMASRGYGESGVGAEVALGDGVIGTVARERRLIRLTSLEVDIPLRPRDPARIGRRRPGARGRDSAAGAQGRAEHARHSADGRRPPRGRHRRRRPRSHAIQRVARGLPRDHRESDSRSASTG